MKLSTTRKRAGARGEPPPVASLVARTLVALVALLGCARHADPESVRESRAALTGTPIAGFFLLARHGARIDDRGMESGGSVGVAAGAGSPADTFTVGTDAVVARGNTVIAPHVVLGARTVIGNVDATQIDVGPQAATGTRAPFVAPPAAPLPGPVSPGTVPASVAAGGTVTLAPGQYGAVNVTGTLVLAGGLYQLASLRLDNDARLSAQASAIVRVAGGVTVLDRVHLSPAAPLRAQDLRLEVAGTADSLGDGVTIGNDGQLTGLVVAQGSLRAGDRFVASGAIAANDVIIGHDARLAFDGGFTCASSADCPAAGSCVAGTCADAAGIACQATSVGRLPVVDPGQPFDLASDGARLYWTDTAAGAVKSAALDGTAPATLVTGRPGIGGLSVDETFLYFTDAADRSVSRVSKAGGTPELIAIGQRAPRFLADDGGHLYWTNQGTGQADGSVRVYTKATGQLDTLADRQPGPWNVAVIGGQIYWSDVVAGIVLSRASPAAAIRPVASGLLSPALVTGGTEPYFLSTDGRLFHLDAAAQQVTPRAAAPAGGFSLAAREPSLFWTNGVREAVAEQLSIEEFPSTLWRRSGASTPRVIRLLAGAVRFSVAASPGPGSLFTFVPDPVVTVPHGAPACPPAGTGAICDRAATPVVPSLECVVETADHRLIAHFGYTNQDDAVRRLGVGPENRIDRADGDACQPTTFASGAHHDAFAVGFVDEISWTVGQHSVTASRSSVRCAPGAVHNTEVSP